MKWGIYELSEEVHVCPSTEEGTVCNGHILDKICICEPIIEYYQKRDMVIHRNDN